MPITLSNVDPLVANLLDTLLVRCVGMRNPKTILKEDLESAERENDCPGRS